MPLVYLMDKDHPTAHASIDGATNTLQTIEYEHHEIHSGSHYFVVGYLDIPGANDVLDMTWQMPNTAKWIHWTWSIQTESAVLWQIYEGVVATNALANTMPIYNSNRNSSNTSGTTLKYEIQADLATADADTAVGSATLLKSGKVGDNQTGGQAKRESEMVMKQNSLYLLRAQATGAGYINFEMEWYEHSDKG